MLETAAPFEDNTQHSSHRISSLSYSRGPTGTWEPLPQILFGFATASFQPSYLSTPGLARAPSNGSIRHKRDSSTSSKSSARNRFSWSGIPALDKGKAVDRDGDVGNQYEQALDIGDEIYAFERFVPDRPGGSGVEWYRGYVSTPAPINLLAPATAVKDPSSSTSVLPALPQPDPSVFVGIFPSKHFHVRESLQDAEGILEDAYAQAEARRHADATNGFPKMEPLREEEDEEAAVLASVMDRRRPVSGLPDDDWFASANGGTGKQRQAMREKMKLQPPLPNLKAGGETLEGRKQPLVDEIASAIREWYLRMPLYLQRREYRLFDIVHQHIDALHMGRRQLLAGTLSIEETASLKKECVARLVKGNVAQGLDVIVRNPVHGGLVVVDPEGTRENMEGWLTGVRMYAMQVALAYIDTKPLDALLGRPSMIGTGNTPTAAALALRQPKSRQTTSSSGDGKPQITSAAFYQCFLDVRAFIASPCATGETVELYFSLYSKTEARFLTEEFCLVMNHLGSPARDSEARIGRLRTLFTDLSSADIASSTYLVCRLVRNGAMKMEAEASSAGAPLDSASRRGSMRSNSALADRGIWRGGSPSVVTADRTEDSLSITSGYDGARVQRFGTHTTSGETIHGAAGAFRRPLGCSVLELKQLARMVSDPADATGGGEFTMPIFVPQDEASFATLHEDIIHGRSKEYERSARAEAIAVSFKVFHGIASTIVHENPSLLCDIPLTRRLGFPDVVFPGDVRNDLYIKLWSGSFSPPVSSGGSLRIRRTVASTNYCNIQVSVEVRRSDGSTVPNVLHAGGSGEPPVGQYQSLVFHHNERPTYGELVKVALPGDIMPDCHLFLTFRNRASHYRRSPSPVDPNGLERPFAFAYLPFSSSSHACLQDGSHNLVLYKMDKSLQISPSVYFNAPPIAAVIDISDARLTGSAAKALFPLRDRFSVRTFLCSTRHTQNTVLLALLDWQKTIANDLPALVDTLKAIAFVSEEEIVKFLPDVFDAFFGILASNLGEREGEFNALVFEDLINVLGIVSDRRFKHFRSMVDVFIDGGHFDSPTASWQILKQMKKLCEQPKSKEFRQMLKVWDQLTKFVIKGRELDRARGLGLDATLAHMEADFKRQLTSILHDINFLMGSTDPTNIGAQTLAVQHYADVLPILTTVYQPIELAEIVIGFADTLGGVTAGKMAIWKLLFLLQVVRCVFGQSDARALLVPALVRWVKPHLGRYNELVTVKPGDLQEVKDAANIHWLECNRLAVTVIALMVDKLQEWLASPLVASSRGALGQEEDNIEYCLTLMPKLLESYAELIDEQTVSVIDRQGAGFPIPKAYPDVFPSTYPFALVALIPKSSLTTNGQDTLEIDSMGKALLNCGLGEAAVIILILILACPRARLAAWIEEVYEVEGPRNMAEFLRSFCDVARSISNHQAFPANWLNVSVMAHTVILRMMSPVASLLERNFVPPIDHRLSFNTLLWGDCLSLLCQVLSSDELVIEEFPAQKRRAVWTLAGDLRGEGALLLAQLWDCLGWPGSDVPGSTRSGGYQVRFDFLVEQVLTLCLSHHDLLRSTAVEILFSMIASEYDRQGGSFPSIESEVFAQLDKLVRFSTGREGSDPLSRAYFVAQLRSVFEASGGDVTFRTKVNLFLNDLESFLDLLLGLRDLPDSPEWTDERAGATLRVMDFIRRIGREDLYIAYVHQLVQANVDNDDWLGAGLALKLHADLYEWTMEGDVVEAFEYGKFDLPPQTQFARKESLYYLILDYLGQAEAYETAINICQELAHQHEIKTFNYPRLSDLLTHQARLYERINDTSRQFPEYFRVAYYGGFPDALRGKQFIARGQPWQKYGPFCDAIQAKHPTATLHRSMIAPSDAVQRGDELVIWVTALTPEPDLLRPVLSAPTISENIQSYWRHCDLDTFSCQRSYRSLAHDGSGENEILDVWIEKTILRASHRFPHALGRADIVEIRTEQISPLSGALHELKKVTASMITLADKYRVLDQTGEAADTRRLSMALNSAVDSPISGGVPAYRKAFLDPAYLTVRPQDAAQVEDLREAILTHVSVIEVCLDLHERLRPPEMASFHAALVGFYHKSFSEEIATLQSRKTDDKAPTPQPSLLTSSSARTPLEAGERSSQPSTSLYGTSFQSSSKQGDFALPPLQMYPGTYDTSLLARPSNDVKKAPLTLSKSRRTSESAVSPVKLLQTRSRIGVGSMLSESPAGSFVNVLALGGTPYSPSATLDDASSTGGRSTLGKKEGSRFGSLLGRKA